MYFLNVSQTPEFKLNLFINTFWLFVTLSPCCVPFHQMTGELTLETFPLSQPQSLSPLLSGPVIYYTNEFSSLCPDSQGNSSFSFPSKHSSTWKSRLQVLGLGEKIRSFYFNLKKLAERFVSCPGGWRQGSVKSFINTCYSLGPRQDFLVVSKEQEVLPRKYCTFG